MTEDFYGNDVSHILGAANHEAARAEYELNAKRNEFFAQIADNAQKWAVNGMHLPSLLKSGLYRTISADAFAAANRGQS